MENSGYYGQKLINNSSLSYINPEEGGCPEKFWDYLNGTLQNTESVAAITGSMVHQALLEPENFAVIVLEKLSDNVKTVVDAVYRETIENGGATDLTLLGDEIVKQAGIIGYGTSWKRETLIRKVCDEGGSKYFDQLVAASGKTVLTQDIYSKVMKLVSRINTMGILTQKKELDEMYEIEVLNEHEIYWEYVAKDGRTYKCKSKIDQLVLNHTLKTFSIKDIKTHKENIEYFPRIFTDRQIYRQIAFYELAVLYQYPDYTPEDHYIISCESEGYNRVRNFLVSRNFIELGKTKIEAIINRIGWHQVSNNWTCSQEEYDSNFTFLLDCPQDQINFE